MKVSIKSKNCLWWCVFSSQRYASVVYAVAVCPSVPHKLVFYQNA